MDTSNLPEDVLLLDKQLCFNLYATSRRVIQLYTPHLSRLDLTYTQYITLLVLWEHQTLSVKEMGERLLLDSGTLTPLLKKMERKGLLTRSRSSQDERIVLVHITAKGSALKQQAIEFIPQVYCASCLTPQETLELLRLARKLRDGLENRTMQGYG